MVDPFIKPTRENQREPTRENLIILEENSVMKSEKITFQDQKPTTIPARKKLKVIVITTFMRSGSTFLGELFNLHPDTFYQFEPLHPYYRSGCDKMLDKKYQSMLRQGWAFSGFWKKRLCNNFLKIESSNRAYTEGSKLAAKFTLQTLFVSQYIADSMQS